MRVGNHGYIREHTGPSRWADGLVLVKTDIGETTEFLSTISLISSHLRRQTISSQANSGFVTHVSNGCTAPAHISKTACRTQFGKSPVGR